MRKLILKPEEFKVQELPIEGLPERVSIVHKASGLAAVADTPTEAWDEVLGKLSLKYSMKVIVPSNIIIDCTHLSG